MKLACRVPEKDVLGILVNRISERRWPSDVFDRRWDPDCCTYGTPKNTSLSVTEDSLPSFGLPLPVMQTAAYSKEIVITWPGGVDHSYFLFLDFADVLVSSSAKPRQMEVRINDELWNTTPVNYCRSTVLYSKAPKADSQYRLSIKSVNPSDEGAVLNSFEVYQVLQLTGSATHAEDGLHALLFLIPFHLALLPLILMHH